MSLLRSLRLSSSRRLPLFRPYSTQPSQQPEYQSPTPPSQQPPIPPPQRPNPHREVYSRTGPGRAVAFNFLIAMVTFQALYWSWLKLESMEIKREKEGEVRRLEGILGISGKEKKGEEKRA